MEMTEYNVIMITSDDDDDATTCLKQTSYSYYLLGVRDVRNFASKSLIFTRPVRPAVRVFQLRIWGHLLFCIPGAALWRTPDNPPSV
jgi:hypothetical protein